MVVGCYVLHLYCDRPEHATRTGHDPSMAPLETTGRNLREAMKEARKRGWRVRKGNVKCPKCPEKC